MIPYTNSLRERKGFSLKHKRRVNESADLLPIHKLYNGSIFHNILSSSGLGKQI